MVTQLPIAQRDKSGSDARRTRKKSRVVLAYGEALFSQRVQQFSRGEKKLGHKFRIVVTLLSSFNKADELLLSR
ncbi:MAG: hypothetical protein ACI9H6_000007 [Patiriisocius sp.]|jgi:hypothetical protein